MLALGASSFGQNSQGEAGAGSRKLINRPTPVYPSLARTMSLSGTVKLEALVAPNGSVKTIQVKGGNPVLVQSAQNAVREWKWEKVDHETTEYLELKFNP